MNKKKLPKMYEQPLNKPFSNTQTVFSTLNKVEEKTVSNHPNIELEVPLSQKIANIFNSKNYIYKADVLITTSETTTLKRIVAKTKTDLITMDNEYIPIANIIDIKLK